MPTITQSQTIPIPIEQAWAFFSNPHNLAQLTPPQLDFTVLGDIPTTVFAGQLLRFRVRMAPGIRQIWESKITEVIPGKSFTDIQLKGPYKIWKHTHSFEAVDANTTVVQDHVDYALAFGFLGSIADALFVKRQSAAVFAYRWKKLEELFPLQ